MKTGLTVSFRNKKLLHPNKHYGMVPVFYPNNFENYGIKLKKQRYQYIEKNKIGLLQANQDYIFVKRFSTKEEARRIQTSYYCSSNYSKYKYISTDNKLNFVISTDINILKGAFLILSSTFFDRYYRMLNGNTQVNSTEINSMKFPTTSELKKLGDVFSRNQISNLSQEIIDKIVNKFLSIVLGENNVKNR